jgi:hypothetical protein
VSDARPSPGDGDRRARAQQLAAARFRLASVCIPSATLFVFFFLPGRPAMLAYEQVGLLESFVCVGTASMLVSRCCVWIETCAARAISVFRIVEEMQARNRSDPGVVQYIDTNTVAGGLKQLQLRQ